MVRVIKVNDFRRETAKVSTHQDRHEYFSKKDTLSKSEAYSCSFPLRNKPLRKDT